MGDRVMIRSARGPPADSQSLWSERCVFPTIEHRRVAEWCPLSHPTPSHIMAGSVLREPWPDPPYDCLSRVLFNEHETSFSLDSQFSIITRVVFKQQGSSTQNHQQKMFVSKIWTIRSSNYQIELRNGVVYIASVFGLFLFVWGYKKCIYNNALNHACSNNLLFMIESRRSINTNCVQFTVTVMMYSYNFSEVVQRHNYFYQVHTVMRNTHLKIKYLVIVTRMTLNRNNLVQHWIHNETTLKWRTRSWLSQCASTLHVSSSSMAEVRS